MQNLGGRYTSEDRALYIRIVESSMPMAITLLSWGLNAKLVAAGDGGIMLTIVYAQPPKSENSQSDPNIIVNNDTEEP